MVPLASESGAPSGELSISVVLGTASPCSGVSQLLYFFDDESQHNETQSCQPGKSTIQTVLRVPNARVWSPKSPNLHTLTVKLLGASGGMKPVDGITVRFGLRTVGVSNDGSRITINGEHVKLLGFNRHDLYPEMGPTLSVDVYRQDLALLKEMGSNFIRGCHYPQDQRFLDLCDEAGMLVWHEALAWGNSVETLTDPHFMAAEVGTANAMVDSSMNNPSVILWGFFNEGRSDDPNATASYATMSRTFKDRDPSRLVTWASNRQTRDKGFEYADVISFNGYPGWCLPPRSPHSHTYTGLANWVRCTGMVVVPTRWLIPGKMPGLGCGSTGPRSPSSSARQVQAGSRATTPRI